MELTAVLEAVMALEGPLEVFSDSTYVVNCFRDGWWEGWLARGWLTSQKKPVANRDLWEPLVDAYQDRELAFRWVKGHSGDRWNDFVDQLASEEADRQRGVAGRRLVVAGLRSQAVDDDPDLLRKLTEILGAKLQMHDDLVVLSGLRHGAEAAGARAAAAAGVPYVAVLPYPDPDAPWPPAARRRFAEMRDQAQQTITLQRKVPDSKAKARGALDRRDAWFAQNAHEALIVWDGEDKGVGRLVHKLEQALGDDVWIVEVDASSD